MSIELHRAHRELLSALTAIDSVCREHGIEYWIDSGTLLGAVRHDGFIPWDDDIDLCMTRANIDRFLAVARNELAPRFLVATPADEPRIGVDVKVYVNGTHMSAVEPERIGLPPTRHDALYADILVADPLAAGRVRRKVERSIAWLVRTHNWAGTMSRAPGLSRSARARWWVAARTPKRVVAMLSARLDRTMRRRSPQSFGIGPAAVFNGYAYPRDVVYPLGQASFEGIEVPVPANTDAYLTGLYGPDYRQLPPPDQRRPHASRIWFDEPDDAVQEA